MPGENLTRVEAQERSGIINVDHYDIALDLTVSPEVFRSATKVTFSAIPGASTFIDAIASEVHSVVLNGRTLDPAEVFADSRIQLDELQAENTLEIDANMHFMNTGEGLHRFVDPADGEVYLYSQFEVPDARRMYPCFEQPDLKATFAFTVTAPSHWQVVSNEPTPQPQPVDDKTSTWAFPATPRISTYITALVAGPYVEYRDELTSIDGRTIPLGVFVRSSLAEFMDADNVFTTTKQGFEYYESHFGVPYPFEKYDQLFVPEYNMGAMENAGCVTFTENYVFRSRVPDAVRERRVVTILHELGHMWFGDLVTMKWWNDLWLNESFAEFISTIATAEATEWQNNWVTFLASEKTWAYRQDQLPSTHPIVAEIRDLDDVLVNFDGITYAKGGSVLKQLFFWVGREAFFKGVGEYFKKHAWGNTELRDLLVELEAASGRDLGEWSQQWLETAGVNTLRPEFEVDAEGRFTAFAITQDAPEKYPTLRPHRLAVGIYSLDADENLTRAHKVELDVDGARTEVPELIGQHRGDLVLINDEDLAYAKIRLDEQSLATATRHASRIADPLARGLVLASLWDATRDGEYRARDYVRLILEHIAPETESTTRRQLLGQLTTAATRYVSDEDRDEVLEVVGDELLVLATEAENGSDAQFAFVRSFAQFARTDAQLQVVADLFTGARTLPGLNIDTDLGWELLFSLVAGGRAGEAEIAARLEEDRTSDGERSAAHARAAIPTVEGKRAAWDSVWTTSGAANEIVRATFAGFWTTHDDDLVRPYIAPYFEGLREIWDSRSFHIAEYLVEGFFPRSIVTQEVADAASAWLEQNQDAPDALRRLIAEGLDDTARALAVKQRDAD
ncbi:aminopeptidase N [Gulosibacter molinativorax]|uniref:Aminopeptidase N n=1 Tax=Gulosibacter molinativorax TaxID=256821 RepID=A0ABT7CAX1_9MICO|nr:aminopeptidase N [Gulosibacter molinativorax]MDJ1371791.1 aminopeptidase N [Gulosibacter molinativorax]QUY60837.1 Aminopeptidase N [Gulosibacter molinativorax]